MHFFFPGDGIARDVLPLKIVREKEVVERRRPINFYLTGSVTPCLIGGVS